MTLSRSTLVGTKSTFGVSRPGKTFPVGADRFLAEIKTTANLQHPHILPLFDSGEADSFTELRERTSGS